MVSNNADTVSTVKKNDKDTICKNLARLGSSPNDTMPDRSIEENIRTLEGLLSQEDTSKNYDSRTVHTENDAAVLLMRDDSKSLRQILNESSEQLNRCDGDSDDDEFESMETSPVIGDGARSSLMQYTSSGTQVVEQTADGGPWVGLALLTAAVGGVAIAWNRQNSSNQQKSIRKSSSGPDS